MTQTTTANLIVPDVWGDAIMGDVLAKAVMLGLADTDDELVGEPGDHVDFPFWAYIGDADDLTETSPIVPVAMSMSSDRAVLKEVGKGIELTDTAVLSALGNPTDQARTQLALSISRKIDADLQSAALATHTSGGASDPFKTTAPLTLDGGTGVISWSNVVDATAKMGDAYNPSDMAGIVLHSKQYADLRKDSQFVDAAKYGPDSVLLRGEIGRLGNVPVFVSDRVTTVTDADPGTGGNQTGYKALIIAKGALLLKYKRRMLVENDRDILARSNIITTNAHYAAKRVNDNGVVVLTTQ